jgi:hypothetical protein
VSGADPIDTRPGFAAMLERIDGNGVRTIIVETASRFARGDHDQRRANDPEPKQSARNPQCHLAPRRQCQARCEADARMKIKREQQPLGRSEG